MPPVSAAEVLWTLISEDLGIPKDHSIEVIEHRVARLNWRQIHTTPRAQALALSESLVHDGPFAGDLITIGSAEKFLASLDDRPSDTGVVRSVTSRIWNARREPVGHLALMNLHPEGFTGMAELADAIRSITGRAPGYLLSSGRYFHYYGQALLNDAAWLRFMAQFLMPCTIVSPRYIGHSIHQGYCALRLTTAQEKPKTPEFVCRI